MAKSTCYLWQRYINDFHLQMPPPTSPLHTTHHQMKERDLILAKTNGNCAYCGCSLDGIKFHVDHMLPIRRRQRWDKEKSKWIPDGCDNPENDCFENKYPACPSCNIQKHSTGIEEFRRSIGAFLNSLNQYHNQYKFAKRYGLVTETNKPVIFYFETLNIPPNN